MKTGKSLLGTLIVIYVIPMFVMLLIIAAFQVDAGLTNRIGKGISIAIGKWPIFATYSHAFSAYLMIAIIGAPTALLLAPFATNHPTRRLIFAAIIGGTSVLTFWYLHWLRIHPAAHQSFLPWVIRSGTFALLYTGFSMIASKCLERNTTQQGGSPYSSPAAGSESGDL